MYGPFFSELILFDREGQLLNYYPDDGASLNCCQKRTPYYKGLSALALPERSHVFATGDGYLVSFFVLWRMILPSGYGALVGRTPVT